MVSSMLDFASSMRPEFHRALIDTVRYYGQVNGGWKSIIYLYSSMEGKVKIREEIS